MTLGDPDAVSDAGDGAAPPAAEACGGWDPAGGERAVLLDLSEGPPRAWTLIFREKWGGALRFAESEQSNAFYTLRVAEGFTEQERPSYILPIQAYRLLRERYGWPQPD